MELYRPEGALLLTVENRAAAEEAKKGSTAEGIVTRCDRDLTLTVSFGKRTGIIPREEIRYSASDAEVRDIEAITRVGKPVTCVILGEREDGTLLLSRREAQKEYMENVLLKARPGDILPARVTHMEQFGAFLDIGRGIVSLLPIDCISVSRISHPRDRFTLGQELRVPIRSIDRETGRICVTHREMLGTWEENAARFEIGQTVAGTVRSVEDYGIFVELAPNLAGLAEYREGILPGQTASVYVKNILPERMKLKLVIVDVSAPSPFPPPMPLYLPDSVTHLDSWEYSPAGASKRIFTLFDGN